MREWAYLQPRDLRRKTELLADVPSTHPTPHLCTPPSPAGHMATPTHGMLLPRDDIHFLDEEIYVCSISQHIRCSPKSLFNFSKCIFTFFGGEGLQNMILIILIIHLHMYIELHVPYMLFFVSFIFSTYNKRISGNIDQTKTKRTKC